MLHCHQGNLYKQSPAWLLKQLAALETLHNTSTRPRTIHHDNGTTKEQQLIFIPSTRCHSLHRRWQLKHHLAAEGCEWNTIPPHSHIWRTCTLLSEIEACLHSRPSVLYPTTLPILHICPLDTFSLVNHSLPTIDKTNVNFNSFSGGKGTNNRYSSSGSANQLITSKPSFIKATCWDTGLSTTRPLCALSSDPLKPYLIPNQF